MGKGDHIVIPKSILKRFVSEDNKLSVLNLDTYKIDKCFPDSIFVKKHYYIAEIDKYIKDNVETIIGVLYKTFDENKDKIFSINRELVENMKKIFIIQFFRNKSIPNDIIKNSIFLKDAGGEKESFAHNLALIEVINYLEGSHNENSHKLNKIFQKMIEYYETFTPGYMFLENTSRTFVIPASQFIKVKVLNDDLYMYPISPELCLIWRKINCKEDFNVGKTSDDEAVKKINKFIVESEKLKSYDCLVIGKHEEINKIWLETDKQEV